jgi:hypothetical protein
METYASKQGQGWRKAAWLLGAALLGGAITVFAVVPSSERHIKWQNELIQRHLQTIQEKDRTIDSLVKQMNEAAELIRSQRSQLAVLELPEAETVAYTLLYEPTQPGQASASPLQLLDLVQPGLGSALAKVAPASPQPAGRPHWLIPGYVKPIFNGDPGGASYIWLNTQSGARDVYAPRGTIVQ